MPHTDGSEWADGVLLFDGGIVAYKPVPEGNLIRERDDTKEEDLYVVEVDEVRPVVSPAVAEAYLTQLGTPPEAMSAAPSSKRSLSYIAAYDSGDLAQQVEALRAIYHDDRGDVAERQNLQRFERLILGEFAYVLGVGIRTLKSRMRKASDGNEVAGAMLADQSQELARQGKAQSIHGLRTEGSLVLGDEIVLSGGTAQTLQFKIEPGIWHVYSALEDEFPAEAILVHHSRVDDIALLRNSTTSQGEIPIEAASLVAVHADLAANETFMDELMTSGGEVNEGMAIVIHVGGDGAAKIVSGATTPPCFILAKLS